jgi:hypothetical protein
MSLVLAEEVLVQAKLCCNKDLKRDLLYIAINHAKEALLNNDVVLQELEKCERIHKSLPATEELRIATKDILRQEFNLQAILERSSSISTSMPTSIETRSISTSSYYMIPSHNRNISPSSFSTNNNDNDDDNEDDDDDDEENEDGIPSVSFMIDSFVILYKQRFKRLQKVLTLIDLDLKKKKKQNEVPPMAIEITLPTVQSKLRQSQFPKLKNLIPHEEEEKVTNISDKDKAKDNYISSLENTIEILVKRLDVANKANTTTTKTTKTTSTTM